VDLSINNIKHQANAATPEPSKIWVGLSGCQRINLVLKKLEGGPAQFSSWIEIVSAEADGQVIVRLKGSLSASQRGALLLDFEVYLKEMIDDALVIWHEALGDRSSLRNLRCIEMKA
jgi:hypothetical protein